MRLALVLFAGLAAAAFTYRYLERLGRTAWPAIACRAVAWSALGLLLLDLSCAIRSAPGRPLVLLDGSLSLGTAGGRWREALDSARSWGDIRVFGDPGVTGDTVPTAGRSLLAPAVAAAAASGRSVLVVTDGEVEDAAELASGSLRRAGVRVFPRRPVEDLAVGSLSGPSQVTSGDTARFEVEVRPFHLARDSVWVEARLGQRLLARRMARLQGGQSVNLSLTVPTAGLQGSLLVRVALAGAGDAEPRDDVRLWVLEVTPTPGVVLIARPADWDARFLLRAIQDVARLPLKGYTSLVSGQWRRMETLEPVSLDDVRQAARRASVLVLKGHAPELLQGARSKAVWLWPSGEGGETLLPGEWYVTQPPVSPLSNAFVGLPVDSFPPLIAITPIEPAGEDWVALSAQQGRRGADRPIVVGRATPSGRRMLTAAEGFWRWAFRGGSSEQAYRGMIAASVSWLLEEPDSARGRARPQRPVAEQGRPVVFEWTGGGPPAPLGITLSSGGEIRADSLRFDGSGRAELRLPPGVYRYRLAGGGEGLVAVEEYSSEFLPRPVAVSDQPVPDVRPAAITSSRSWIWLFGLTVLGLAGEWLARRRLGLR